MVLTPDNRLRIRNRARGVWIGARAIGYARHLDPFLGYLVEGECRSWVPQSAADLVLRLGPD